MAWSHITGSDANNPNTGAAKPFTLTVGTSLQVDDRVIVQITVFSNTAGAEAVTGVTATFCGTFTKDVESAESSLNANGGIKYSLWSAPVTSAGTPVITITWTGDNSSAAVDCFRGLDNSQSSAAVDISSSTTQSSSSGSSPILTTGSSTTAANELTIGAFGTGGAGGTITANNSQTLSANAWEDNSSSTGSGLAYKDSGAIGTQTVSFTDTIGASWGVVCVVYKLASGAGQYIPLRIPNRRVGPQALRHVFRQPYIPRASSGANAFTQSLTATLSFIGALTKRTSTGLSGTLSFIGALVKQARPLLTGTLSFVGAISKAVRTGLTGTLSFVGAITKAITKGLTGTLSFVGSLLKQTSTHLAGALSFIGNLVSSHVTLIALTATLSFSGSLIKQTAKQLTGSLSFTGTLLKAIRTGLSGVLSFTGSITKAVRTNLSGVLSFIGSLNVSHLFIVALTATLSFAGSLATQFIAASTGAVDYVVKFMRRRR